MTVEQPSLFDQEPASTPEVEASSQDPYADVVIDGDPELTAMWHEQRSRALAGRGVANTPDAHLNRTRKQVQDPNLY